MNQPGAVGWGRLVVHCSYTPMSFLLAASGPGVYVDGQSRGWRWGPTVLDLPAGQHHLHVHTRYMGQMGKADAVVPIGPGQLVELYYRAPLTVFSKGRLTPAPQRAPGTGLLLGILGGSLLLLVLIVLVAALA